MSENKENVPERQCGVTPEELARMGIDEEGIFNFLHDAIGTDVGTEVLREFSNSDHFAELLDVVTSSLSVGEGGRSRRESVEPELVAEASPGNSAPDRSNSSTSQDITDVIDEAKKDSSSSSGSSVKICDTGQNQSDSQSEEPLLAKESESINAGAALPENTKTEQSEKHESNLECQSSTKPASECGDMGESLQLKKTNVDDIGGEILKSNNESEQLQPENEKFTPLFDNDFLKYQSRHGLKHCSIIICDVLRLGNDFVDLTSENKASLSITKEIIKETLMKEKAMRLSYAVKLNKRLDSNILKRKKDGSENRQDTSEDKEVKNKSEGKIKSRREIESGSDSSSSSSDIQFVKRKSDPNTKKKEEGEQSKSKPEYSAGGTRILPFERKRIPEENRPRKFDKFERMFKEKSKGVKKEKPVIKIEPAVPEKTFASSSFRIPKKKDGQRHKPEKKITALTPLASQDIPSENLKFERFRKTKNNEDRPSKTDPYQNKDSGREREAFINEHIKIEIELADEPDSFADDDGTASQTAPLSEVKVGHLVLSVATFLRENPTVELPFVDDATTISELLVVKIAWWFRTLEKDPAPDEICVPELIDKNPPPTPICDEDDGSDISFLGHVSNAEEETEECQINEVSSSSYRYEAEDSGKSEEFCGSALLNAKIRTAGENFQNIFDLRNGASYDKENFQAKCNLCNELIVGKTNLSLHLKKQEHKENFLNTSLKMAKSDEKSEVKMKVTDAKIDKIDNKEKDSKTKEKEREKDKDKSVRSVVIKKDTDQNGKTDGDKAAGKARPVKVEMERTKTSTGLPIKVPIMPGANRKRSRSKSRTRSPRRRKSKSPRGKSRSPGRRSPIQLVVRSPQRISQPRHSPSRYSPPRHRHKRRSRSPRKRSRSPRHLPINRRSRSPNRRRSSSLERVEEFLARTNRGRRSRSPSNISKRQRRSRSRSPKPIVKTDNKEFHEKLALTVDGKWTASMESQWNLMEGEQNMYLKQFQERQKELQDKPEDHPRYADEWTEFWERRYQEVEKAGKDPDTYNYVDEWKEFWMKRVIFLLQAEADMKIKEIKMKYGMDYESLRKIRFTQVIETPKVEVESFLPTINRVIVPSNVLNFPPPLSVSDRGSDDQMSRAMSISDDGRSDRSKSRVVPPKKASPKKANVTVDDIKSTWESLTGQKIGSAKSDAGSSSVASYDFDGFDLVQVLRLMCQIDQTLGIYAQQVQEFFRTAEELEISKRNKSYSLLNKKDFVELLFKCRDKFMNVIRANVVARDVLKSINLTVYALNAILDSPQCQQFKPALDAALAMELEPSVIPEPIQVAVQVAKAEPPVNVPPPVSPQVKRQISDNGRSSTATISDAVAHLTLSQKNEIAGLIAKALVVDGKGSISDSALMQHLKVIFAPMIANISGPTSESYPVAQEINRNRNVEGARDSSALPFHSVSGTRRNEQPQAPNVSIGANRLAIPSLPTFGTRAATPPPSIPNPLQNAPNPFLSSGSSSRVSSQYHPYGGSRGFAGRGRPTSPVSSGRRSPFSRRGYAGNPEPEDKDTGEEDNAFLYEWERPSSDINVNLNEAVSKLSNELLATKEGWSGIFSPPTSVSVSSEDLSLDEVPNSVKLPPGILNLIRKERSTEGNTSSSRYTSTSRTKTRDLSQNRERRREMRHKRERQSRRSPNSPSPSEKKENSREGRRDRHSREKSRRNLVDEKRGKSRRSSVDEDREKSRRNSMEEREKAEADRELRKRREERHRRARRSKSSSRSSIIRLPLQGPSQGVNSMHQRSSSEIEGRQSKEKPSATPFNYGSEVIEVDNNIKRTEKNGKSQPGKLSKPSRGVSAIFWETSSISGGEGKCDAEAAEDAFTKDKIKARHYRKDKVDVVDLEPGEIISSSTDFSDAESILKCDPRMEKHKRRKKRSSAKSKNDKEAIISVVVDSQDSFDDFDECMTKENIVPVVDLDTSFEEREQDPRKVKLDLPMMVFPLVKENITAPSQDMISDGSLTDYESPSSPTRTPKKKISMTEPVTPDAVQTTIRMESKSNVESRSKNLTSETNDQSSDKFPLGSEILSDGELSNVTFEHEKETSSISNSNSSSKLERIDSAEDDVLSKVSTASSGNVRVLKTGIHENLNHTDNISSDSAQENNDPVLIDHKQSPNNEEERSEKNQEKEFSVPVVCDDEKLPSLPEKSPNALTNTATDNLESTNVDSMEEEAENINESENFVISISKNIFESVDASSDDEIDATKTPLDTVSCSIEDKEDIIENADGKSSASLINDVSLVTTIKPSTSQPMTSQPMTFQSMTSPPTASQPKTSSHTNADSTDNVPEEMVMKELNVSENVDIEFSNANDNNGQQNLANTDDIEDYIDSYVERKVLIEKEQLVTVELDGISITDSIEVTEEFLQ